MWCCTRCDRHWVTLSVGSVLFIADTCSYLSLQSPHIMSLKITNTTRLYYVYLHDTAWVYCILNTINILCFAKYSFDIISKCKRKLCEMCSVVHPLWACRRKHIACRRYALLSVTQSPSVASLRFTKTTRFYYICIYLIYTYYCAYYCTYI